MAGVGISLFLAVIFLTFSSVAGADTNNYVYESYLYNCPDNRCSQVTLQRRRCNDQWSGCHCDIPLCKPECQGDQVCGNDHTCACLKSSSSSTTNCEFAQCQSGNNYDCYPGTCSADGINCTCPTTIGFSGENCLDISLTPTITACTVEVQGTNGNRMGLGNCIASGVDNSVTWLNSTSVDKITSAWTSDYDKRVTLPTNSYIKTYLDKVPVTIGVTGAGIETFVFTPRMNRTQNCDSATPGIDPRTTVFCSVPQTWNDLAVGTPSHNDMFRVTVWAMLGGQKTVIASGSPRKTYYFNGTKASRSALFKFDLISPAQCLSSKSMNDAYQCPYFPIYLDQDIRTDSRITVQFYNWTDDGSGIAKYEVAIYKLGPGSNSDLLENVGDPLAGSQQTIYPGNEYSRTMTDAGIYSIEVTAYDFAKNSARARKIFIYNSQNSLKTNPDAPVYLVQANSRTNVTWLTKFDDSQDGSYIPLTVTWKDHFRSAAGYNEEWGKAVKPWDISGNSIDDSFGQRYGRRSIASISSLTNGIAAYAVSYFVDQTGGGRGLSPRNWIPLNSTETSYNLPINQTLLDGYTIVVWVQATDASFGTLVEKLVIGVDRSPPEIKSQSFELKTGLYKSSTSVLITVSDLKGGISQISYRIFVSGNPLEFNVINPTKRPSPPPGNRQKRDGVITACYPEDKTCYCIPQGDCYNYNQSIDIDNCLIDRYGGQYFEVKYTVTNLANQTSIEQSVVLGFLPSDSIPCRAIPPACSSGCIAGIVIGVIFGILLLILLIIIIILLVRTRYYKKPIPRRLENFGKTVRRAIGRSYEEESAAYQSAGAFSGVSKKMSVIFNKNKKVDDDEYIYTGSEAVRNNSTRIQRKNLQMDNVISNEGRFAVIRKAYLQDGNERKTVAVKALRSGFSGPDVKLMEEKIQFLSGVPRHANLVNFLGASEEENSGGPVMVLEYCGIPLKDWLKQQQKVTSEVLENMLTFTLNVARGVEHLHENEIIHRRLAVRNVLLTQQFGGWVAKLIGYGPNREDSGEGAKKAAVPVKWLSPETLSSINNIDPVYDKKTDVWSFGITAWEIYSLGEAPYPGKSSNEAKKLIIKGLKPTKPDECPADLYQTAIQPCWDTNPSRRPDMSRICSAIDDFKKGSPEGHQGGYYTAGDDDEDYSARRLGGSDEIYDDGQ